MESGLDCEDDETLTYYTYYTYYTYSHIVQRVVIFILTACQKECQGIEAQHADINDGNSNAIYQEGRQKEGRSDQDVGNVSPLNVLEPLCQPAGHESNFMAWEKHTGSEGSVLTCPREEIFQEMISEVPWPPCPHPLR